MQEITKKELFNFYFERRLGYHILPRDDVNRMESDDADLLIEIYRYEDNGDRFTLILYPTNKKTFMKDMRDALTGLYLDMEL